MRTLGVYLGLALVLGGPYALAQQETQYTLSKAKMTADAEDAAQLDADVDAVFNSGCSGQSCCEPMSCCSAACCCGVEEWGHGVCNLFPQHDCGFRVFGWVNGGFMGNTDEGASQFNGPYNAVDRANEATLNQMYLVGEKSLSRCGCSLGGRIDLLYGTDSFLAESVGLEKRDDGTDHWNSGLYGFAMPQAYVSLGNQQLNVQVGHFYSIVGYEGVMAPENFFYSKSYSYQFAGPFTHWGGQVNWKLNRRWTVQAGVHNGWDALDRESDALGVIGKVRYDGDQGIWSSFAVTSGRENNNASGVALVADETNRTRYSLLVGLPITCRLEYVFHHWLGVQQRGAANGSDANWYGVDQYLYYTVNKCWKVGARFEWFRDEDGTRVGLNRPSNPNVPPFAGDFYSLSLGVNYSPFENLIIRPEVRADWYDGSAGVLPYNDGLDDNQLMLGLDVIARF